MGRKRLDESDKKISVNLSVKKKYIDALREKNVNISQLFEEFVIKFLK